MDPGETVIIVLLGFLAWMQFLIWRTVDSEAKATYRTQGEEILAGGRTEVTA